MTENTNTPDAATVADAPAVADAPTVIERIETGKRFLFTVLFVIVVRLLEVLLLFIVLYELLSTLITKQPPSSRVTRFAQRALSYAYDIVQYITYNNNQRPFPFADFSIGTDPIDHSA